MNLTKNFTLDELTKSSTADRLNIDNTPNQEEFNNLKRLCTDVLQPIRDKYGKSISVNSGYRSKALNKAVGGASTSQHVKGEAADITTSSTKENKVLFDLIVSMIKNNEIKVGQIIDESNYKWLHISLPYSKINQVLHL